MKDSILFSFISQALEKNNFNQYLNQQQHLSITLKTQEKINLTFTYTFCIFIPSIKQLIMKNYLKIWLIILAITISQQAFPQKENSKGLLTGEQQIELLEGYSFVSSRIIPENPDMIEVLQENLVNLDFVRNTAGLMLRKIGPNWINGIGDWVNTEGYLFRMNDADELTIVGDVIDPQIPIELSFGYQIIGYLPGQALNTEEVFQDVLENLEFVRNTAGMMFRKIGPVWVNSIGDMQPGEGYLVKMYAGDILIYPSTSFICGNPFTDHRDGQTYNTVLIGTQCWMSENLNIGVMINSTEEMTDNGIIEKYCYDNNTANCDVYGGLFQWNEMMQYTTSLGAQGICPAGWHIPTDDEWKVLEGTVDSQYPVGDPIWNNNNFRGFDAGLNLKSTSGWYDNGNGTDLFGFTALPGGYCHYNGAFLQIEESAYFYSSTEVNSLCAWRRYLSFYYDGVNRLSSDKDPGFSVRCLLGEGTPINQPPEPPSSPNPEDGAENQSIDVDLSWTCTDPEGDPLTYDIYFGTEATPPLVTSGQTETTYDPGTLENNTEYFWKIVAHDDHSNTTEGSVWNFSTETAYQPCPGIPTITYEGQVYNTVLIGDQCWLKENLAYLPSVSPSSNGSYTVPFYYVYDYQGTSVNDAKATYNYQTYGVLYNWPAAITACPAGWHLPTDDEWKILEGTVDSQYPVGDPIWNNEGWRGYDAGLNIKSTSGWYSGSNGDDLYGYSALPGGFRDAEGYFYDIEEYANFWSSTEFYGSYAWARTLCYYYDNINRGNRYEARGYSVRCLKDETINQPPEPPSSPNPDNGAENQSIEVDLSWTCTDPEGDPLTYDIYFGTEATPPLVTSGQTETTYDPGTLENNTEYFWKIVAHDDHSNTTEGPVWSFITETGYQPCPGIPTVTYEGQVYNTVLIGEQCWLKENLNVGTLINGTEEMTDNGIIEKYCYDNNVANCDEYGGLYQWNEIMQYTTTPGVQGICPSGWHIPTDDEIKILEGNVDSQYPVGDPIWNNWGFRGYDAGLNLKSTNGWYDTGNGTDAYGFTALPGGYHGGDGYFYFIELSASFWSSTENNSYSSLYRILSYDNTKVFRGNNTKSYGWSVRCLLGEGTPINQPPEPPSSPNPEDGAENQSIEVDLSWTCTDPEGDPLTYDIYFGIEATPSLVTSGQTETTYNPGTLENYTEYFWKIVAHDDHSNTTEGPVWNFITETGPQPCPGIPTVTYEGQVYNTVLIGEQCWLKENLNIGTLINGTEEMTDNGIIEKYCYDNNNTANCDEYGGLYQWNEMMQYVTTEGTQGICPAGWHIPTDDEIKILEGTIDSQYPVGDPIWNNTGFRGYDAGLNLKSTSGWNYNLNGLDVFGFTGLPGGLRYTNGDFYYVGENTYFWSSTENNNYNAWYRSLNCYSYGVNRDDTGKDFGLSVRCLKD